jgi:protein-S-isoprenylcysteine O-methyltransferase Ste14
VFATSMDRTTLVRAAALYVPIAGAGFAAYLRPSQKRLFAASLVAFAWTLPSLLLLQMLNLHFEWWSFHADGGLFREMPIDLYLGWAVLWSIFPVLLFRKMAVPLVAVVFSGVDLLLMPLCRPVVALHPRWLLGEAAGIVLVLLPALFFARWTLEGRHLVTRAIMQAITAAAFLLFFLPELVFNMRGYGWTSLFQTPPWLRNLLLQAVVLLAVPAISAAQEFVTRGNGTPIPYDPPRYLVTSGIYRYIANPMQLSSALVMAAWGMLLKNPWIFTVSFGVIAYSIGLAGWDERADLEERFVAQIPQRCSRLVSTLAALLRRRGSCSAPLHRGNLWSVF